MRHTKIICTLGPASSDEAVIRQMLENGMNIARFNFSHGDHESHKELIERFRSVRDEMELPAAVLLDTKGPEIRIGNFENGFVYLDEGAKFTLTTEEIIGDSQRVYMNYANLPSELKPGVRLLLDDGKISLIAEEITKTEIRCRVTDGGTLSNKKSVNIPYHHLNMPYLSEKDKSDLIFAIENDVDFVAASFVRSKDDVIALRKFLDFNGGHSIRIISKIENNEGVDNFDEILQHSDGIMVARGDMGVEVEFERLPGLQKMMIKKCYQSGKMVITATQMLESMIKSPTPTRAEISDVANAVFDGTSAVMLSGETAMGVNPAKVVSVMAKIAEQAENDAFAMDAFNGYQYEIDENDIANAICDAACTTARDIHAKAVIAVTKSGHTARRASKFRPQEIIVGATPDIKTFHQLSLSWGVAPVLALNQTSSDALFMHAIDCAKQIDLVQKGDTVVIIAGIPVNIPGMTNLIKVATV